MTTWVRRTIALGILVAGCGYSYEAKDPSLAQNWDVEDQRAFYRTTQGSQLMPYEWFLALERPDSRELFVADQLRRFGYLADARSDDNPDGLPIGFVKHEGSAYIGQREVDGDWIGMTCAACHTAELVIDGQSHRIDGAPTDADFLAFIQELDGAIQQTSSDPEKFERFRERIGAGREVQGEMADLAERFGAFVEQSTPRDETGQELPWGRGRLDAVTLILNQVAYRRFPDDSNVVRPNAPVSYPFLWDTHQQPHNQWNGVSKGSLSRNTTQVLGVFATFDPDSLRRNSVEIDNLEDLQQLVVNLRSPRWTDPAYGLPALDHSLIDGPGRGRELYENHCASCHAVLKRSDDQVDSVPIMLNTLSEIGTDPGMATLFAERRFVLEAGGDELDPQAFLVRTLFGIWLKNPIDALLDGAIEDGLAPSLTDDLLVYKARPLNGIWATAPYLHNGSVPDMVELMKAPEDRVKDFCVGGRTFSPKTLGFEYTEPVEGVCPPGTTRLDVTQPGNSNAGHDPESYGAGDLTEEQISYIIEFIKSE